MNNTVMSIQYNWVIVYQVSIIKLAMSQPQQKKKTELRRILKNNIEKIKIPGGYSQIFNKQLFLPTIHFP